MRTERATLQHLEPVSRLFDAYRRFYGQAADPDAARRFIEQRLHNGDAHIICALSGEDVAGFVQLFPTLDSIGLAPAWILHDLFVDPAWRRRGVARLLMQASRELGVQSGASLMTLCTGVDNLGAQALYESEGWERDDAFQYYELHLDPR
ncbi:MAG: GNAT family N-acetyltransferase [Halofilum sp. (in: g-proteobacteria)]|nr:GNAT family N-acetyltransferase [Halofilum sp. (in: g-proteobacteria)]